MWACNRVIWVLQGIFLAMAVAKLVFGGFLSGEVSYQQLNDAINGAIGGTSNNSNGVGTLDISISDPPTQYELQQVLGKLNELIGALRR